MTRPALWFFALWRCALIAILGIALRSLYGWDPSPLIVLAIVAIALDTVATLYALEHRKEPK